MGNRDQPDEQITRVKAGPGGQQTRLHLQVLGPTIFATHPLPATGDVVIGRSRSADICIDDPTISRRHAVLHLGPPLSIEDLGGANGTKVRGAAVSPGEVVALEPGGIVHLGSTVVLIQTNMATVRPRRLWSHGFFEARLEDECLRAEGSGSSFAVARLHIDGAGSAASIIPELLGAALRPGDILAAYGPEDYEILFVETAAKQAEDLMSKASAELAVAGIQARTRVVSYPRDGRSPEVLVDKASALVRRVDGEHGDASVIVQDDAMRSLYELVDRVAAGTISVLLLGETGVGKEVVAEAVHRRSPRCKGPFLRLNCSALTESLFESELFGHEKGAFTGADKAKPGMLETAAGGTVFLDEVGELPMLIQTKLLRVIETRQVQRVGSLKPISIDVRFVSATNRDLEADVARGSFRQDLFFRLNGISLQIPPLRERTSEIEALAHHFITQAASNLGRSTDIMLAAQTMAHLRRYAWPGNIRELRNVMERAVLLCNGGVITPECLPIEKMGVTLQPRATQPGPGIHRPMQEEDELAGAGRDVTRPIPIAKASEAQSLDEDEVAERDRILDALARCAGNQTQAAKLLGMSRRTIVKRLRAYDILRPRKLAGSTDGP